MRVHTFLIPLVPSSPSGLDAPPAPEPDHAHDGAVGAPGMWDDDQTNFYREVNDAVDAEDLFAPDDGDDMDTDHMNDDMVALVDVMQTLGVDPVCVRFVMPPMLPPTSASPHLSLRYTARAELAERKH